MEKKKFIVIDVHKPSGETIWHIVWARSKDEIKQHVPDLEILDADSLSKEESQHLEGRAELDIDEPKDVAWLNRNP